LLTVIQSSNGTRACSRPQVRAPIGNERWLPPAKQRRFNWAAAASVSL
jgi:hypothetical protein